MPSADFSHLLLRKQVTKKVNDEKLYQWEVKEFIFWHRLIRQCGTHQGWHWLPYPLYS